ncbi:MAG: helix-turn-helix domain-containing protein [Sarcina sp.]
MVGKKIKFIRMKKQLNQREFAKEFDISKSALSNYERELNVIPASFLIELIKKYKLDANVFVYDHLFEEYKDDLVNINFKILNKFTALYTEILKCFSKMTFEQQGLPEIIEINELKLKELLDKINGLDKNIKLNSNFEMDTLLSSLEDLYHSLNIFLIGHSKSKEDIQNLLISIEEKIKHIHNLFKI